MSSFPSIRIEGGLLGPELLDQVIAADVPGQKPADFGLEPKRNSRTRLPPCSPTLVRFGACSRTASRACPQTTSPPPSRETNGCCRSLRCSDTRRATIREPSRWTARLSPSRTALPSRRMLRPFTSLVHGRNLAACRPADAPIRAALARSGISQSHRARLGHRHQRLHSPPAPRLHACPPAGLYRV